MNFATLLVSGQINLTSVIKEAAQLITNTKMCALQVVQILKAEDGPLEPKPKPVAARSLVFNACDLEDYTSTTYLNDLNRHRQLVME